MKAYKSFIGREVKVTCSKIFSDAQNKDVFVLVGKLHNACGIGVALLVDNQPTFIPWANITGMVMQEKL